MVDGFDDEMSSKSPIYIICVPYGFYDHSITVHIFNRMTLCNFILRNNRFKQRVNNNVRLDRMITFVMTK